MPNRIVMFQLQPEAVGLEGEIIEKILESGGNRLPGPLVFPPMICFRASKEVAKEIQEKYKSSIERIVADQEEDGY